MRVALFADSASRGAFSRISRWFQQGCAEIGIAADAIYLEGPAGDEEVPGGRAIRLGARSGTRAIRGLTAYLKSARPSMLLAAPGFLAPYALFAGRIAGTHVVPWEQSFITFGLSELPLRKRLVPSLQNVTYRWAPAIAAVSQDLAVEMGHRFPAKRTVVLPNPADAQEVRNLSEPPVTTDRIRFCAVGRLNAHKAFGVLIDAAKILSAEIGSPWELVIAGRGPDRRSLEEKARKLGLATWVRLLGDVPNPYPLMAGSTVFVHPARREGFGLVILEAMALGLPVIATTCPGGPHDILSEGQDGVLVPPDDAGALARAMQSLATDKNRRTELQKRGLARVQDFYPAAIAKRVVDLALSLEDQ